MLLNHIALILLSMEGASAMGWEWKTRWWSRDGDAQFWGCVSQVQTEYTFDYGTASSMDGMSMDSGSSYANVCSYAPATGSVLLCADELYNGSSAKMSSFYKTYTYICHHQESIHNPPSYYKAQYVNATQFQQSSDSVNASAYLYRPALPFMANATSKASAYYYRFKVIDDSVYYAIGIIVYFVAALILAGVHNLLVKTGRIQSHVGSVTNAWRSHVIVPALLPHGKYEQPAGWKWFSSMLPNRAESLFELGLFVLHMVFWCLPYYQDKSSYPGGLSTTGGYLYGIHDRTWCRMVGYRTGILAFGKLPLAIFFAGRNNFLSNLTGIKYSVFINWHKTLARYIFVDSLIHSVAFSIIHKNVFYNVLTTELLFKYGMAAMVICTAMVIFSWHPFRAHYYEFFLYLHIICALFFVVTCWYHCVKEGWNEFIVATCIFWGYDRFVRVYRMATFGYQNATITPASDRVMKIVVDKPSNYITSPGQYAFIYFSDKLLGFQNHPVTPIDLGNKLVIYMTVKNGVTRKVYNKMVNSDGLLRTRVCLEGPYGTSAPIFKYDNALIMVAGSGFPTSLNYAFRSNNTRTSVKLVWVIRNMESMKRIYEDVIGLLRQTNVTMEVYLTQGNAKGVKDKLEKVATGSVSSIESFALSVHSGRPDLKSLLHKELVSNSETGTTAVLTCGPASAMDEIRDVFSDEVKSSTRRIELFDEYQRW